MCWFFSGMVLKEGNWLIKQIHCDQSSTKQQSGSVCITLYHSVPRLSWFIFFYNAVQWRPPFVPSPGKMNSLGRVEIYWKTTLGGSGHLQTTPIEQHRVGEKQVFLLTSQFCFMLHWVLSLIICICDFKITEERTSIKTRKCKRGLFRRFGLFWWPGPAQNVFQQGMELEAG